MCSPFPEDRGQMLELSAPEVKVIALPINTLTTSATIVAPWDICGGSAISRRLLSQEGEEEADQVPVIQLAVDGIDSNMDLTEPPHSRVTIAWSMMSTRMNSILISRSTPTHHPNHQDIIGGWETTWGNGCRQAHSPKTTVLPNRT